MVCSACIGRVGVDEGVRFVLPMYTVETFYFYLVMEIWKGVL